MALEATYPSPFGGEPFTYFIIGELHENRFSGTATVAVYGFVNRMAREALSAYVPISLTFDASRWIKDASIAEIYGLIKSTPDFASATDA